MQSGDWRLQPVGRGDNLPLIRAVAILLAFVVIFFLAKALLGVRR